MHHFLLFARKRKSYAISEFEFFKVPMSTIRVLLVDDHAMVREGLAALLSDQPGIEVVGQCADGLGVMDEIQRSNPDVLVLDISLPGLNGLDLCRELARKGDAPVVLLLTMHKDEEYVLRALDCGAQGYLIKDSVVDKLSEAIQAVAAGKKYLGPGLRRELLDEAASYDGDRYDELSTRERQVLQLIAEGLTNREIAETLDLSIKTVDTHRTRLMRKLNIHSQAALVKYAIRRGIVFLE
jgi:two-component system, NarL family, response regulator NreC